MQTHEKGNGISAGVRASIKTSEADTISEGISCLYDVTKKIKAHAQLSDIRQEYAAPLDALVRLAGRGRDIKLLAQLHNVMSVLESEGSTAEQKDMLLAEISQVEKMLQQKLKGIAPAPKGILSDQTAARPSVAVPEDLSFLETTLRSFSAIGENEIRVLKKYKLLDEERFINTDATAIAGILGLNTNAAFEVKELVHRRIKERTMQDVTVRAVEMQRINEQLADEIERITEVNNTMFMNNKELKSNYAAISVQHDREAEGLKGLQGRAADSHIEFNRLAAEIEFLKNERKKLLDTVEAKHELLDNLLKRFTSIRAGYEFVSGEAGFAEDLVAHLESLLKKAFTQKKSLTSKIESSEESLERLFFEFSDIVRKGKMAFYENI